MTDRIAYWVRTPQDQGSRHGGYGKLFNELLTECYQDRNEVELYTWSYYGNRSAYSFCACVLLAHVGSCDF